MMKHPTSKDAWDYVQAIVAGDVISSKYLKMACKKLLREYTELQHNDEYPWIYSEMEADRFLYFSSQCRYPDGLVAGENVDLHPWQYFVFAMAYGWRSKSNLAIPRFNDVYTRVARKNDKTTGLSTVIVYELLTGPSGHEQYITAVNREQAGIAFRKTCKIAESLPNELSNMLTKSYGQLQNNTNGSFAVARSRDNKASDGASAYRGYWDEAARIEDEESFDIIHSSQGAWQGRHQNWYISTAQANRETRYYQDMEVGRRLLEDSSATKDEFDRKLYVFYELDDMLEWDNPDCWLKSNPSMGLSIDDGFLRQQLNDAKDSPSKKSEFLRKYCNIYTATETPWLDINVWKDSSTDTLSRTGACYVGLDMGKTSDLNAITTLWVNPDGYYEAEFTAFLPRDAVKNAPKHTIGVYQQAITDGHLHLTDGHVIDHRYIKDHIQTICSTYDVKEVVFDPYKSQNMITELTEEGLPMVQQRQGRISLGPGTQETERLIISKLIKHTGNRFMNWQLGNAQVSVDKHDLPMIEKPTDYAMKIDNVTALVMCVARATVHGGLDTNASSVYIF